MFVLCHCWICYFCDIYDSCQRALCCCWQISCYFCDICEIRASYNCPSLTWSELPARNFGLLLLLKFLKKIACTFLPKPSILDISGFESTRLATTSLIFDSGQHVGWAYLIPYSFPGSVSILISLPRKKNWCPAYLFGRILYLDV